VLVVYIPALYRPADRGRTWRSDAPNPPTPLVVRTAITLDDMKPVRSQVMAPLSCVTSQEIPGTAIALVGRDRAGVVRFRFECERDDRVARWGIKVLRLGLAMFYDSADVELKLMG
jgi:hypothetical protein